MKQLLAILLLAGYGAAALADKTVCRHGDKTRTISVDYEKRGESIPCRVKYEKADSTTYPWSAQNTEGYCEEKAAGLVARHEDEWGWKCKTERSRRRR